MDLISETNIHNNATKKVCIPGDKLFDVADGYRAGNGCFEFYGKLLSSLTGYVHVVLYKFVQPGDIILARVLGYGEAQTSYLLTIAEDQLGVITGRGQNGQKLLPDPNDFTMMKAQDSEYREMRKMFSTGNATPLDTSYINQTTANNSVYLFSNPGNLLPAINFNSSSNFHFNPTIAPPTTLFPQPCNEFFNSVGNSVTELPLPSKLPALFTRNLVTVNPSPCINITRTIIKPRINKHLEPLPRNSLMLKLFSGRLKDEDLPPNCECPQNNSNKLFPFPECHAEDVVRPFPFNSPSDEDDEEERQDKRLKLSSLTSKNLKSASSSPCSSSSINRSSKLSVLPTTSFVNLHSSTSKAKSTTASLPLELNIGQIKEKVTTEKASTTNISPNQQLGYQQQLWKSQQLSANSGTKRFSNKSLLILKNGKRVYAGTNECYQYADKGVCNSGIFCVYEHGKSLEHMKQKVCQRLMRGLCRETSDDCPGGLHSLLLPHQMPVCDFYLRLVCSKHKDECKFLHVRHTAGTEPCPEFNRGCCHKGISCDKVHRYYYSLVKQKSSNFSMISQTQQTNNKILGKIPNEIENELEASNELLPFNHPPPSSPITTLRWIS